MRVIALVASAWEGLGGQLLSNLPLLQLLCSVLVSTSAVMNMEDLAIIFQRISKAKV